MTPTPRTPQLALAEPFTLGGLTLRYRLAHGRLPVDVFELAGTPRTARMLPLSACDGQQATVERHESDPRRALLRL